MTIPWPDTFGLQICAFVRSRHGEKDSKTDRLIRKTMMRYVILTYVLVFRDISEQLRRRFPTYNHLVPSLLTEAEKSRIEAEDIKRVYWMPIEWATQLLKKCYRRGQIDEHHYGVICQTISKYREMMHNILSYDWVNVPLVYTQVVHICTLAYFGISCVANQTTSTEDAEMLWINEFVIPFFAIYEFILFVGWLKVAQVMLNPFGMDEDDFEMNMLIERNLMIGYSYVEHMYDRLPPLVLVDVSALPHTKASMALIRPANQMVGSVANVNVPQAEQQVISKEDVERIRKLVGPKFGRRFDYVPSKLETDQSKSTGKGEALQSPLNEANKDAKEDYEVDSEKVKAPAGSRVMSPTGKRSRPGSGEKDLITAAVARIQAKLENKLLRHNPVDDTQSPTTEPVKKADKVTSRTKATGLSATQRSFIKSKASQETPKGLRSTQKTSTGKLNVSPRQTSSGSDFLYKKLEALKTRKSAVREKSTKKSNSGGATERKSAGESERLVIRRSKERLQLDSTASDQPEKEGSRSRIRKTT